MEGSNNTCSDVCSPGCVHSMDKRSENGVPCEYLLQVRFSLGRAPKYIKHCPKAGRNQDLRMYGTSGSQTTESTQPDGLKDLSAGTNVPFRCSKKQEKPLRTTNNNNVTLPTRATFSVVEMLILRVFPLFWPELGRCISKWCHFFITLQGERYGIMRCVSLVAFRAWKLQAQLHKRNRINTRHLDHSESVSQEARWWNHLSRPNKAEPYPSVVIARRAC